MENSITSVGRNWPFPVHNGKPVRVPVNPFEEEALLCWY